MPSVGRVIETMTTWRVRPAQDCPAPWQNGIWFLHIWVEECIWNWIALSPLLWGACRFGLAALYFVLSPLNCPLLAIRQLIYALILILQWLLAIQIICNVRCGILNFKVGGRIRFSILGRKKMTLWNLKSPAVHLQHIAHTILIAGLI